MVSENAIATWCWKLIATYSREYSSVASVSYQVSAGNSSLPPILSAKLATPSLPSHFQVHMGRCLVSIVSKPACDHSNKSLLTITISQARRQEVNWLAFLLSHKECEHIHAELWLTRCGLFALKLPHVEHTSQRGEKCNGCRLFLTSSLTPLPAYSRSRGAKRMMLMQLSV